ncbi:MAG: nucleotidyltransferase [Bacteroidota bacterium]
MSNRDWKLLFEDILESISKIQSYSKNLSFDDFAINSLVIDGVVRNEVIDGEGSAEASAKYLSRH